MINQKTTRTIKSIFYRGCITVLFFLLSACAITNNDPRDPFESYNRKAYAFNTAVHKSVLRPAAKVYNSAIPWPIRKGIYNVFINVYQLPTIANDLLQGDINLAMKDVWRFIVNTTFGIGGLFDVAQHMGLERTYQDLGITLAKWGDRNSPYIVVPLLGPSTIRDSFGILFDYQLFTPYPYIEPPELRYGILAAEFFVYIAQYVENEELLKDIEIDPYVLQKNAYLQRRDFLIRQRVREEENFYVDDLAEDQIPEDEEQIADIGPFIYVDE
ncbi:MAG: VacJ family lipoprotein [Gammaproteobacteria bacterium]